MKKVDQHDMGWIESACFRKSRYTPLPFYCIALYGKDQELQKTVNPVEEFNLPMYYRLVTETYDWNPVPAGGGLSGSFENRTTKYDWVRTWKLEDN